MSTCIRASYIRAAFSTAKCRQLSLVLKDHDASDDGGSSSLASFLSVDDEHKQVPLPPALIQESRTLMDLRAYFVTPFCSSWSRYCKTAGLLRVMGKMSQAPSVGIVGGRKANGLALHRSYMLGRLAARAGWATVSGGAIGVDIHALEGAHEAGGPTMTVLGSGLSYPSPRRHLHCFARYSTRGAIISPYPCGFRATRWSFVKRNRWIAELSKCLVVVHVSATSGAMHTVRNALNLGRPVFLLSIHQNQTRRTFEQELLNRGANCVSLLVERLVGLSNLSKIAMPREESLRMILKFIGVGAIEHEKLRERLDLSLGDMLLRLFKLEKLGLVARDERERWYRRGVYWNEGRDWWVGDQIESRPDV